MKTEVSNRLTKRRLDIVIVVIGLISVHALPCFAQETFVISEFLAINDGGQLDEDGDDSDWVEVCNRDGSPQNLDGWYLTDDPGELTRWRFPSTNVASGGYTVVFASGKDRALSGSELHTSFGLRGRGEYLALVEPDGVTIATEFAPMFPRQRENVSFGFSDDKLGLPEPCPCLRYFAPPTPVSFACRSCSARSTAASFACRSCSTRSTAASARSTAASARSTAASFSCSVASLACRSSSCVVSTRRPSG